jgi:hypothetical protein
MSAGAGDGRPTPDTLMAALLAAVSIRVALSAAECEDNYTEVVGDAYSRLPPEVAAAAAEDIARLADKITAEAAAMRREIAADPAAPGQRGAADLLLAELGELAALTIPKSAADPADPAQRIYHRVCAEIQALMLDAAMAREVWALLA